LIIAELCTVTVVDRVDNRIFQGGKILQYKAARGKVLTGNDNFFFSDSVRNGYGTELSDIIKTLEEQRAMDPQQLKDRFWDMFIVDAKVLTGNDNFFFSVFGIRSQ